MNRFTWHADKLDGLQVARISALLSGPILFGCILKLYHPEGLSAEANAVLACTLWMAAWWITEAVPISVTAMLPIILFPLTGAMNIASTTSSFGHKYIFLFIGGFIIATALQKWNMHRRISLWIIKMIGADISNIVLGFMLATAFLSMWISNTATTVMMLPIGMSIISQLNDNPATEQNENKIFGRMLMLSIAYAASIGGMATLIGTPPNLILAGVVQEIYSVEITFSTWLKFGLPISVVLLIICWIYLVKVAFKLKQNKFPGGRQEILRLYNQLGKITYEEKVVSAVFLITAFLWTFRSYLQNFIPPLDDTIIAMFMGTSLFLLPTKDRSKRIITWEEAVKLPWGILLLFGGGMALASAFQSSGLAIYIGSQLSLLNGLESILLILIIISCVNFLTEITSNLATTAMLLPILGPMAYSLDIHPYMLMVSATVAASCAFMLPVATPPNAVVFGSGYLKIPDMVKAGFWMNLLSILVLSLAVYYLLPFIWDFKAGVFPNEFLNTIP